MEGTVKRHKQAQLDENSASTDLSSHISTPPAFNLSTKPIHHKVKQIWAIGGGKGGVGKSLLASSLAISLSRMGNSVTAIDLDLGGANLHTALGIDNPKLSLSDYFNNRVKNIKDCVIQSGIANLSIISGAQDAMNIASLGTTQKENFLIDVKELSSDYIIFDLGAGTGDHTIDFFIYSDIGIITLLPEPTSIENAYRFIKSAYFRYLIQNKALVDIRPLIELALDPKNHLGIRSPSDLFKEVNQVNPEAGIKLKQQIEKFSPFLVVNQTRTQTDIDIGHSVKTVCKKYFGIDLEYSGNLDYDSSVWQSVRRKKPLMTEFPNSTLVANIEQITQNILKCQTFKSINK